MKVGDLVASRFYFGDEERKIGMIMEKILRYHPMRVYFKVLWSSRRTTMCDPYYLKPINGEDDEGG